MSLPAVFGSKDWADSRFKKWFERGDLLTLCLDLRMSVNGAAAPWESDEEMLEALEYIRVRLRCWERSLASDAEMDYHIYRLCCATLRLVRNFRPDLFGLAHARV